MTIKPIRNDDDLKKAFRRLEKIFQAEEGTPQADERDALVTQIEAHENEHCGFGQADPEGGNVSSAPDLRARKNRLSPKKLLLTKWTAVKPRNREKHFVVTRVIEPEPPSMRVEQVELEAVHSKRVTVLHWRELTDASLWRQGWT